MGPLLTGRRAAAAAVAAAALAGCGDERDFLLRETFGGPDGLVTNEYATYNSGRPDAVSSDVWRVTSGSLLRSGGRGWTGVPDGEAPDPGSQRATDSAVFRLVTKQTFDGDVSVSFTLVNAGLHSTPRTPARGYDGVHVILRWKSERQTYYVTVNRRDGTLIVKKKLPSDEGDRYVDLAGPVRYRVPFGRPQRVRVTLLDLPRGAVSVTLAIDGIVRLRAIDNRTRGRPIHGAGRVGLRGDNDQFYFDDFTVARPAGGR